jgi:hypothetical protein
MTTDSKRSHLYRCEESGRGRGADAGRHGEVALSDLGGAIGDTELAHDGAPRLPGLEFPGVLPQRFR